MQLGLLSPELSAGQDMQNAQPGAGETRAPQGEQKVFAQALESALQTDVLPPASLSNKPAAETAHVAEALEKAVADDAGQAGAAPARPLTGKPVPLAGQSVPDSGKAAPNPADQDRVAGEARQQPISVPAASKRVPIEFSSGQNAKTSAPIGLNLELDLFMLPLKVFQELLLKLYQLFLFQNLVLDLEK